MAKKTTKKVAKKTTKKAAPADELVGIYELPSKEERDAALAESEKHAKAAKAAKDEKLKVAKAKVERGLKAGKKAIDMTMERVMSQMRQRLLSHPEYLADQDDGALAHEVVRMTMSEMTQLKPEDLT